MLRFKRVRFVKDIILTCVRWYVAYPLSYRQVEELMMDSPRIGYRRKFATKPLSGFA